MTIGNMIVYDVFEFRKATVNGYWACSLYRGGDPTGAMKWMAKGMHIPFPVRSCTWFAGFEPKTMQKWMEQQGWFLVTRIIMP